MELGIVSWIIMCGFIGYIILVGLLFFFPNLLHKSKRFRLSERVLKNPSVVTFAHRGGGKEHYENSIGAFLNSIKLGIFGLELDVHKTKCGQLVVSHDKNLLRTTGQDMLIQDLNYNQIGNYLTRIEDSWAGGYDDFTTLPRERPPLLEDLCQLVEKEDVMLVIDLKSNDPNDFELLCQIIVKYHLEDKAVIGGFSSKECKLRIQKMKLKIPMFFDVNECLWFFIATFFGFLPLVSFPNDWLMIPHAFDNFYISNIYKKQTLAKVVGVIFWIEKWYFGLVSWHMNRRGIPVVFWVLNSNKDWELGIKMRANGLMTDFPSRLKQFLKK